MKMIYKNDIEKEELLFEENIVSKSDKSTYNYD